MGEGIIREVGVGSYNVEVRERELVSNFLKPALDKDVQMVRHHDKEQSTCDVIRRIMNNHPVVLQTQGELVDERWRRRGGGRRR